MKGLPCDSAGKESAYNAGPGFDPWVGKIPVQFSGLENSMDWNSL